MPELCWAALFGSWPPFSYKHSGRILKDTFPSALLVCSDWQLAPKHGKSLPRAHVSILGYMSCECLGVTGSTEGREWGYEEAMVDSEVSSGLLWNAQLWTQLHQQNEGALLDCNLPLW